MPGYKVFCPRNLLIASSALLFPGIASAKECDSELDAHLTARGDKDRSGMEAAGAVHSTTSAGTEQQSYQGAINFAHEHTFGDGWLSYFNGGIKLFSSDIKDHEGSTSEGSTAAEPVDSGEKGKGRRMSGGNPLRFALRSAYVQYEHHAVKSQAGLMDYKLFEGLLLDERGAGLNVEYGGQSVQIRGFGAQTIEDFAREGKGCSSKSTFDKKDNSFELEMVSKDFAGIAISFEPGKTVETAPATAGEDEFAPVTAATVNPVKWRMGLAYYAENVVANDGHRQFYDAFVSTNAFQFTLGVEGALQTFNGNQTFGHLSRIDRPIVWGTAVLTPFIGYTAYERVKGDYPFAAVNSNIFLGDRMQYLTTDNRIAFGGLRVQPTSQWIVELAHFQKNAQPVSNETDLSTTFHWSKMTKIKAVLAGIEQNNKTPGYYHQGSLEIRQIG